MYIYIYGEEGVAEENERQPGRFGRGDTPRLLPPPLAVTLSQGTSGKQPGLLMKRLCGIPLPGAVPLTAGCNHA